ncbi:MAG: hypothetical protein DHS20C06_16790 [Hyphobacterium sp.]|nr:MAG: hypothetical protein DHS20C06_16790 [Hyphobacterium sp.]
MILQRITHAIREQNWFAVILEFVIVIAGVVIGFQVTGWADRHAEAERAELYFDRLVDDLEENERRFRDSHTFRAAVRGLGEEALGYAAHPEMITDSWRVVLAYFNASQAGGAEMVNSTYSEMVATGDFRLIDDLELRGRLSAYYSQTGLNLITDQLPAYRETVRGLIPIRYQNYIWVNCYDTLSGRTQRVLDCDAPDDAANSDLDALARRLIQDEALNNELRFWVSNQFAILAIHQSQVTTTAAMLDEMHALRRDTE